MSAEDEKFNLTQVKKKKNYSLFYLFFFYGFCEGYLIDSVFRFFLHKDYDHRAKVPEKMQHCLFQGFRVNANDFRVWESQGRNGSRRGSKVIFSGT